MPRFALVPFVLLLSVAPAAAQPSAVQPPAPPKISMPSAAQAPLQAPTVDDVMTLGRPPAQPTSVDRVPVLQRPAPSSRPAPQPSLGVVDAIAAPLPPPVSGSAKAFDGNTLVVAGSVFVLDGADAPELEQICLDGAGAPWRCGEKSLSRLSSLVGNGTVKCVASSVLEGGALAGRCSSGKDDLGSLMVREGLAVAFLGNSTYKADESSARSARRGVWSGSFDLPWVHRSRPAP